MPKSIHYLLLLMVLIVPTGCETVNGAACGMGKDVQNASNPDKNGWNTLQGADAWVQKNFW
ncbi:MAG: hypothetical protein HQL14_03480 [Candidatus Omnitrophica bacterium]|nr:hypothetical protein [Candidatus Omnitrophota bacterium]